MAKLIVNNAITVNGAFEAPAPDDWLVLDEDSGNASLEQFMLADAMVLGHKTYEGLAAVWPQLAGDPAFSACAERMNGMPKYVASRTLTAPLEWNATLIEVLGQPVPLGDGPSYLRRRGPYSARARGIDPLPVGSPVAPLPACRIVKTGWGANR